MKAPIRRLLATQYMYLGKIVYRCFEGVEITDFYITHYPDGTYKYTKNKRTKGAKSNAWKKRTENT